VLIILAPGEFSQHLKMIFTRCQIVSICLNVSSLETTKHVMIGLLFFLELQISFQINKIEDPAAALAY
jgi:hypothetical protein